MEFITRNEILEAITGTLNVCRLSAEQALDALWPSEPYADINPTVEE